MVMAKLINLKFILTTLPLYIIFILNYKVKKKGETVWLFAPLGQVKSTIIELYCICQELSYLKFT